MKKFAVILAGCGRKDGSEINEAITLLLSLEQHHCEYQCFAPNRPQTEVIDHLTDEKVAEERNILTEAARLARSQVKPIEEYKAADYDGLLFSGGYGVAKNLCDYAYKGAEMEVKPDVARARCGPCHRRNARGQQTHRRHVHCARDVRQTVAWRLRHLGQRGHARCRQHPRYGCLPRANRKR